MIEQISALLEESHVIRARLKQEEKQ